MGFAKPGIMRVIEACALVAVVAVTAIALTHRTSATRVLAVSEMSELLGGMCVGCMLMEDYTQCYAQDQCTICQGSEAPAWPGLCNTALATSPSNNPVPIAQSGTGNFMQEPGSSVPINPTFR